MGFLTTMVVAGIALNTYGMVRAGREAKKAGEAQQRAAESEAGLMDYNAQIADLQAQDAIERGAEDESRFRVGVRQLIGEQRVGFAAQNVSIGEGTPLDVQVDTARLGELDALTRKTNARREAWGYQVEAYELRERARITRTEGAELARAGRSAAKSAYIGAAGNALLTGGTYLEARYGFGQKTT